jgi:Meiotically up-regulated gene 113
MTYPAYMSRASLAQALDMSESTVDSLVASDALPAPDPEGVWNWAEVDRALCTLNERRRNKGTIYVVGFANYVKIGFTSGPLVFRIAAIQTGSPEVLAVIAEIAGPRAIERNLHRRFARFRLNGEWFRREGRWKLGSKLGVHYDPQTLAKR